MLISLMATLQPLLQVWLACALLTFLIHAGVSLLIDRRPDPGSWEKWALGLLALLGSVSNYC